jgi:glutaredoxin 3
MAKIEVYSATYCPYCDRAKALLKKKGVEFIEYIVDIDTPKREEMEQRSQRRTIPQIFINDQHIGGCDDLYGLDRAGNLDPLLL